MSDTYDKVAKNIKPGWLKIKLHNDVKYADVSKIVEKHGLHTICDSGKCPNKAECWSRKTATFMILGDVCTRSCKFCATKTGKPLPPEQGEPEEVAESIRLMGLKHAVLTSVDRDDLPDGGAGHWAETIRAIRRVNPDTTIEVLIPDFDCRKELLDIVIDAAPDIIGHNIETVERLTPLVRSRARYRTSLEVLSLHRLGAARWPKAASCSASERPKPRYWQRSTTWPMRDAPSSRWASTCVPP